MCEESTTSNNCEKIKGVDTCLCGRGLQCDDSKPKCVDYYGNSDYVNKRNIIVTNAFINKDLVNLINN